MKAIKRQYASAFACLAAAVLLGSCSNEMPEPKAEEPTADRITFNISLPSTGKVTYGDTRAMLHTEEEYDVTRLYVYDYLVNGTNLSLVSANPYEFKKDDNSLRPAGTPGTYTVSIPLAVDQVGNTHRFYFVANMDVPYTGIAANDAYATKLQESKYAVTVTDNAVSADQLHAKDFVMSGVAQEATATGTGSQDIVLKAGANNNINVSLTRIEARFDLYSNNPKIMITDAWIEDAYTYGYVMPDHTEAIGVEESKTKITLNEKTNTDGDKVVTNLAVTDRFDQTQCDAQQLNATLADGAANGVRKALYMFERPNDATTHAVIKVKYVMDDGKTGIATVPFRKRLDDGTLSETEYVDIQRNHLYKVVIGDGTPTTSTSYEVAAYIIDEPWNVIDLPAIP